MLEDTWQKSLGTLVVLFLAIMLFTVLGFFALLPLAERMVPDSNDINRVPVLQQTSGK